MAKNTFGWFDLLVLAIATVVCTLAGWIGWKLGKKLEDKHEEKDERLKFIRAQSGLLAWCSVPFIFLIIYFIEKTTNHLFVSSEIFMIVMIVSSAILFSYYQIRKRRG